MNLSSFLGLSTQFFSKKKYVNLSFNISCFSDYFTNILLLISFLSFIVSLAYTCFYYPHLTVEITLWNSLPWGVYRLAIRYYIFIIPAINFLLFVVSLYLINSYLKFNVREVARFIGYFLILSTFILWFSLVKIISFSRVEVFVLGEWISAYLLPFLIAFILSFTMVKGIIRYANNLRIIEYPSLRKEPSNVLKIPTPRGGGIAFGLSFIITSLLFLGASQRVIGLILGTLVCTITGYLDDRIKLNFTSRLFILMPLAVVLVVFSGFVMLYIPNPFGVAIKLDTLRFSFNFLGEHSVIIWGALASCIWLMWVMNMISWNNGTDGQFVAITAVAALAIGILSLRFDNYSYETLLSAKVAFITLGAILGLLLDTLPNQKIVWGFSATSVGLILGALSLLSGTRIAIASIVLIIPSIDVIWVIVSRLLNKKTPFHGDRNHLHHKLLDMGWSKAKVTLFYWVVSVIFGSIAVFSSGNSSLLTLLLLASLVLGAILILRKTASLYNK